MSIKLFDLEKKEFFNEKVPAEAFMRFMYNSVLGRLSVWALFKRAFFSKLGGLWSHSKFSKRTIAPFIKNNNINVDEMLYAPENFKCFNDFFIRALKDGARVIEGVNSPDMVSFPSDGRHLLIRNISQASSFYVKGQKFNLAEFFKDKKLAKVFEGCDMLISRLAPVDYHRFHFPISGTIVARKEIKGALFSVSPIALVKRLSILWENKRVLNFIENQYFGMCAFVEIGATNVGSIVNLRSVGESVERGDVAGYFNFAGSCVITLIPKDKFEWNETLIEMSSQNVECYTKAGKFAGK